MLSQTSYFLSTGPTSFSNVRLVSRKLKRRRKREKNFNILFIYLSILLLLLLLVVSITHCLLSVVLSVLVDISSSVHSVPLPTVTSRWRKEAWSVKTPFHPFLPLFWPRLTSWVVSSSTPATYPLLLYFKWSIFLLLKVFLLFPSSLTRIWISREIYCACADNNLINYSLLIMIIIIND